MTKPSKAYDAWSKYEPLSPAEKEMFNLNIRLVFWCFHRIPKSLRNIRIEDQDLIQEGYVALGRAVQTFNPYLEFQFSSYACPIITNRMLRLITRTSKTYIVPKNVLVSKIGTLPREYSLEEWGKSILGGYRDPLIQIWENGFDRGEYPKIGRPRKQAV